MSSPSSRAARWAKLNASGAATWITPFTAVGVEVAGNETGADALDGCGPGAPPLQHGREFRFHGKDLELWAARPQDLADRPWHGRPWPTPAKM